MDSITGESNSQKYESINVNVDDCNVLQSSGVRRSFCAYNEVDRFILGNRLRLLFRISPLLWIILLFLQKGK